MIASSGSRILRGVLAAGLLGTAAATGGELGKPGDAVPGSPVSASPRTYGTAGETGYVLASPAFDPFASATAYAYTSSLFRYATSGNACFEAPLFLPAGAVVIGMQLEACDTDAALAQDVESTLYRCASPDGTCSAVAAVRTTGAPGCGFYLASPVEEEIDNQANAYAVQVCTVSLTSENRFRAVRVYYRLQISPAPLVATFGDVPTDHLYFRAIEALAAAGITGGCGNGNFCPSQNVTRGEIAAFLARALGLHWAP